MKRKRIYEDDSMLLSRDNNDEKKKRLRTAEPRSVEWGEQIECISSQKKMVQDNFPLSKLHRIWQPKPEEGVVPDSGQAPSRADAVSPQPLHIIAASLESQSDEYTSLGFQITSISRENGQHTVPRSGEQKARQSTRSRCSTRRVQTRHSRAEGDKEIPDSDPLSILSLDTQPSPRLIMASFKPEPGFSFPQSRSPRSFSTANSSKLNIPSPCSSPWSDTATRGSSPRYDHDLLRLSEPPTRLPSPVVLPDQVVGPISTNSPSERVPAAITKKFSHPTNAVLENPDSPKPRRINGTVHSHIRTFKSAMPALRPQSSTLTPSLSLPLRPVLAISTPLPNPAITLNEETPTMLPPFSDTDADSGNGTTAQVISGTSSKVTEQARARTLVVRQLMLLLCTKLDKALAENNFMDISGVASRGVEALGLLL